MDEEKRPLSFSEKFKNVCLGIAALSALILGMFNVLKGEPVAEKTWTTLRTQVNDIASAVNKLSRRVVFLQAHESGRTAAEIQLRLEAVQKDNASLRAALAARQASPTPTPVPKARAEQKCSDGHLLADGRCQKVPMAVAKKVKADEAELRRHLAEEKKRRQELERRKQQLMQQLQQQPTKPPEDLKKLPLRLDEAAK